MTTENLIKELERYRTKLAEIKSRFTPPTSADIIHFHHINPNDEPKFKTIVIEIIDLLNDSLGQNKYSGLINQLFNEGISNYYNKPSITSIENIIPVLDSALTRLRRNPAFSESKKENVTPEIKPLEYPNKITLKWLYAHVPFRFWIFLISIFITGFTLGATFTTTKIYKSLIALIMPSNNIQSINDINNAKK